MEYIDFRLVCDVINILRKSGTEVRSLDLYESRIDFIIADGYIKSSALKILSGLYEYKIAWKSLSGDNALVLRVSFDDYDIENPTSNNREISLKVLRRAK